MAMEESEKDIVYFGKTDFRGAQRLFGIKRQDRRQHLYVIGKSGTGKTTLMHNMMVQDIMNGEGVCVVDPHGEFVESLLKKIPESRKNDVIYFNPSDSDYSIGFNVLELPDTKYKHLVASGLMGIFTKIWSNVWSARMEYILNNAILALLDTPGSTLLGIMRILVDREYRQRIVSNVKDPVVRAFWVNEFEEWKDQFRNEAIAPIQNKVGQFLSSSLIRNIIGQRKSTINILDIMNSGKIFLVNVAKGRIGEDNSALLGAMIITKIQLASMERVRIPEDERVDFFLYVDEFQNFATDSFANILSEARKYRLALILAHQYIGQLVTDVSTKVRDAVFGNVGTMIVFRVGASDAEFMEKELTPEFSVQDMVNLPNRSIYVKLMVNGLTSRPFSASTLPPFKGTDSPAAEEHIVEISRKRYARSRWMVEKEINEWSGMETMGMPSSQEGYRRPQRGGGPEREGYVRLPPRREYREDLAALGIEFAPASPTQASPGATPRREFQRGEPRGSAEPGSVRRAPAPRFTGQSDVRHPPRFEKLGTPPQARPVVNRPAPAPTFVPAEEPQKSSTPGPTISLKDLENQKPPEPTKKGPAQEVDVLKNALEDALKNLE